MRRLAALPPLRAPAWPAILLALLAGFGLAAEPREDFLRIDQSLALGFPRLLERLEAVRAARPVVGLHLSGGSARAFAHLGVLRRLEEEGIRPDVVVTNSMGSVIGLLYAAGVPLEVIEDIFRTVDFGKLFTLKLPTAGGVADLRGLEALVQALVGEVDVSALPLPVVVVCEDLRSMRRVLLAEGNLGEVLRAAIAIPALFEPVRLHELVLIDGGITNLVPLEPFAGLSEAVISATAFYDRKLEPNDPFTVFTMAINIGKSRTGVQDIRRFQPFLIRTDVEEFSFMGWHLLPEIQRRGYDSCSARIPELREYLGRVGVPLPMPAAGPGFAPGPGQTYRRRWREIKRRLEAGQSLPLPRGFTALQAHAQVLRRYRGANRLVQSNFAAASFLYEKGAGGVRLGLLSDLDSRHGAFLGLKACPGALGLDLDNYLLVTLDGGELRDPLSYHLLKAAWSLPVAGWLAAGPYLTGELLLGLESGSAEARIASGLRAAARGRGTRAGAQAGGFWTAQDTAGLEAELFLRQRLAGPVHAFGRAFLRACRRGAEAPGFNDFYRGLLPDEELSSLAVLNADLILAPERLAQPLWESLIFRDLELSLFGDLLLGEPEPAGGPAPSLGMSLQGEAALGGLIPLRAMLSAGYDLRSGRAFATLSLGRAY